MIKFGAVIASHFLAAPTLTALDEFQASVRRRIVDESLNATLSIFTIQPCPGGGYTAYGSTDLTLNWLRANADKHGCSIRFVDP